MQKLKDIMTKDVQVVGPSANLNEVARIMRQEDAGFVPVCDGNKIQGIITDRDIVVRALADYRNPGECRASDIMTPEVQYCYEDDSVREASQLMQDKQVRRVLVVDREKNLKGVISLGDLTVGSGSESMGGEALYQISESGSHLSGKSSGFRSSFGKMSGQLGSKVSGGVGGSVGGFLVLSGLVGAGYYYISQNPELREQLTKGLRENFFKIRDQISAQLTSQKSSDEQAA